MPTEFLLNAYIDANIMLVLIAFILLLGTGMMRFLGYHTAHRSHLKLVNGVLATLLVLPLVLYVFKGINTASVPNISDFMLSLFLSGHIPVSAVEFNSVLGMREVAVQSLSGPQTPMTVAVVLVFAGLISFRIALIAKNIVRLVQIIRKSYSVRSIGRIQVVSSDLINVPFTTRGLKNYYVVVPIEMLGNLTHSKVALGHEFQHIRQGDLEWELLLELVSPLFYFNPAFSAIREKIRLLREYTCDQEFLLKSGFDRKLYCKCLIDVARKNVLNSRGLLGAQPFAVPLVEARSKLTKSRSTNLGKRILAMSQRKGPRPSFSVTLLLTGALCTSVFIAALAVQQPKGWSHDRIMLSTVMNLERLEAFNGPPVDIK
jgi:hypothetical protein